MKNNTKLLGMLAAVAVILVFGLIMFRASVAADATMFCTDNNIGNNAMIKSIIPRAFWSGWYDFALAGNGIYLPAGFTFGLLALVSPVFYTDWFHFICLCALHFLLMYLRRMGLVWPAAFFGCSDGILARLQLYFGLCRPQLQVCDIAFRGHLPLAHRPLAII